MSKRWERKDHLHLKQVKEIQESVAQLEKLSEKVSTTFFGKFYILFGGYEKQRVLLELKIAFQLAQLANNVLANQSEHNSETFTSPRSIIEHQIYLLQLQKQVKETHQQVIKLSQKVGFVSRFLHKLGVKTSAILTQEHLNRFSEDLSHFAGDLTHRINHLNLKLQLPANFSIYHQAFKELRNEELLLNPEATLLFIEKQVEVVEKEAYHFISDQLSNADMQGVNTRKLDGNVSSRSLSSTQTILAESFGTLDHPLLHKLDSAQRIREKMESISEVISHTTLISHVDYLAAALDYSLFLDESPASESYESMKDGMKVENGLSREALVNHVCHDIIAQNRALTNPGDFAVINTGTDQHAIFIEFTLEKDGSYSASIFNTGSGVGENHRIERDEKGLVISAKPLKIGGLKQQDIMNYHFIESLVESNLKPNGNLDEHFATINQMYANIRKFLIDEAGGKDISEAAPSYTIHKRGTCSYSSIDAWLQSKLSPEEMTQYRYSAAKYAADKLGRLILLREEHLATETQHYRENPLRDRIFFKIKDKELEAKQAEEEKKEREAVEEKILKMEEKVTQAATQTFALVSQARRLQYEYAKKLDPSLIRH